MKSHHRLPVLVEKFASESEFIEFWAEQYDDPRDQNNDPTECKPITKKMTITPIQPHREMT